MAQGSYVSLGTRGWGSGNTHGEGEEGGRERMGSPLFKIKCLLSLASQYIGRCSAQLISRIIFIL